MIICTGLPTAIIPHYPEYLLIQQNLLLSVYLLQQKYYQISSPGSRVNYILYITIMIYSSFCIDYARMFNFYTSLNNTTYKILPFQIFEKREIWALFCYLMSWSEFEKCSLICFLILFPTMLMSIYPGISNQSVTGYPESSVIFLL